MNIPTKRSTEVELVLVNCRVDCGLYLNHDLSLWIV